MLEIRLAKKGDEDSISVLLARLNSSDQIDYHQYLQFSLAEYIKNDNLLVIIKEKVIIGCLFFSFDPRKLLNINSSKDYYNFLDYFDIKDELLITLDLLFIDVIYRLKGYGNSLLSSFVSKYKKSSIFIENAAKAKFFFEKHRFINVNYKNEKSYYIRKYIEPGLCKNISW